MKCACGGFFEKLPDLEGMYCSKCGQYTDITIVDDVSATIGSVYDPERAKQFRGVPMTELVAGAESKGRIKMTIPSYCSKQEGEKLINMQLDYLSYLKNEIDKRKLDIYSSRGKKECD